MNLAVHCRLLQLFVNALSYVTGGRSWQDHRNNRVKLTNKNSFER